MWAVREVRPQLRASGGAPPPWEARDVMCRRHGPLDDMQPRMVAPVVAALARYGFLGY